ncbi:MAG: hypothetical protein ACTTHG_05045 [Treponemataceae bacterium]
MSENENKSNSENENFSKAKDSPKITISKEKISVFGKQIWKKILLFFNRQDNCSSTCESNCAGADPQMQNQFEEFIKQQKKKSKQINFGTGLRHFFDFALDVAFLICLIFVIKPALLSNYELAAESSFMNKFFAKITSLFVGIPSGIDYKTLNLRNFFFVISILCYIAGKIIISLTCKNSNKSVSCFLVLALAISCILIRANFILFIVFYVLLFLIHQFSCGFAVKAMFFKLLLMIIIIPVLYIILNCIFLPELHMLFKEIFRCLFLPTEYMNK